MPEDFTGWVELVVVILLNERFQHSKQGFVEPQTLQIVDDWVGAVIAVKDDGGALMR
ncbi:MAG: hypothetical protein ACO4AA_05015 [Aquiluna sp.]